MQRINDALTHYLQKNITVHIEAGESALWGGVILSAFVVPFALLDYPVGRWIDRKQKRFLSIFFGLFACGAGVIAFSFAHSPVLMLSAAAGTSVGFAFFYVAANGIFDSFSTYHARGLMTGVWQSAEDIGFVIGPILGGLLADIWGLRAAFMFFGFIFWLKPCATNISMILCRYCFLRSVATR